MRGYRAPILILAALLSLSLWNASALSGRSQRLLEELDAAERQADAGQWPQAVRTLDASYQEWRGQRTYLHIVARHDAADGADAFYRRCILYARAEDELSFLTELENLREELRTLSEMEQFSIGNVL